MTEPRKLSPILLRNQPMNDSARILDAHSLEAIRVVMCQNFDYENPALCISCAHGAIDNWNYVRGAGVMENRCSERRTLIER